MTIQLVLALVALLLLLFLVINRRKGLTPSAGGVGILSKLRPTKRPPEAPAPAPVAAPMPLAVAIDETAAAQAPAAVVPPPPPPAAQPPEAAVLPAPAQGTEVRAQPAPPVAAPIDAPGWPTPGDTEAGWLSPNGQGDAPALAEGYAPAAPVAPPVAAPEWAPQGTVPAPPPPAPAEPIPAAPAIPVDIAPPPSADPAFVVGSLPNEAPAPDSVAAPAAEPVFHPAGGWTDAEPIPAAPAIPVDIAPPPSADPAFVVGSLPNEAPAPDSVAVPATELVFDPAGGWADAEPMEFETPATGAEPWNAVAPAPAPVPPPTEVSEAALDAPAAPATAWWDDETDSDQPRAEVSEMTDVVGRFALGGVASAAGYRALVGITFPVARDTAPRAADIGLTAQGIVNCEPDDLKVMSRSGFEPSADGFTIVVSAASQGPFMVSGTYRVS